MPLTYQCLGYGARLLPPRRCQASEGCVLSSRGPEERLAQLVEEWHALVARGVTPDLEDFRRRAGPGFEAFLGHLEAEAIEDSHGRPASEEILPRTFGEYTLLSRVGAGGMGLVYRAVHRRLARIVALKVLTAGLAGGAAWARFQRGARAAAQVEHEHVVRIFDCGVFEGQPFIAMSFVEGRTLRELFRGLGEIPEARFGRAHHELLSSFQVPGTGDDTLAYCRRIVGLLAGPAHALAAYHARGIVHRDVKPDNVIVDESGRAILLDFDLVRTDDTQFETAAGTILGTPAYSSPEQLKPDLGEASAQSDVYGLGAVLFHAVTLHAPHPADSLAELIGKVTEGDPPDPSRHVQGLPGPVRQMIRKALEREPQDRYASMSAFAADLTAFAGGGEVSARPAATLRRLRRRLRRSGLWVVGALLLVVVGALAWRVPPEAAYLDVLVEPRGAQVSLEGRPMKVAEGALHLVGAGPHRLRLALPGFRDLERILEPAPSGPTVVVLRLEPIDPRDPLVLEAWCRHAGIVLPREEPRPVRTAGPEAPAQALWPRGRVRPTELAEFVVAFGDFLSGELVLRDARGTEVARASVAGEPGVRAYPSTGSWLEALRGLEAGSWGFVAPGLPGEFTRFEVNSPAAPRAWPEHVDPITRELLEAADLLGAGLLQAAFFKARGVEDARLRDAAARIEWSALRRLGLTSGPLAEETVRRAIPSGELESRSSRR